MMGLLVETLLFEGPRTGEPGVWLPDWQRLRFGGGGRTRCPCCGWRPSAGARWACSCGETWNTFATRGRCPGCSREWQHTQCLRCHAWSPHEDWYAPEADRG
jgi:hypothetical protein